MRPPKPVLPLPSQFLPLIACAIFYVFRSCVCASKSYRESRWAKQVLTFFLTTTLFGEVLFHVQIRVVNHCWCMYSSCGHFVHSISKSHSNSWNIGFIICTLLMSWPRPQNPESFDQGHIGFRWVFLKTLVVLNVKYHLSWRFDSWIVHLFDGWPSLSSWPI